MPQKPYLLYFLWLISNEICYEIWLIFITCVAIQQFWKKLVKPLKNCFFGSIFHKYGVIMGCSHHGTFFSRRNNKSRSSAFRNFLFYQNIICFDWVITPFLSWVMFSVKKASFPAKTAVQWNLLPGLWAYSNLVEWFPLASSCDSKPVCYVCYCLNHDNRKSDLVSTA